MEYRTKNALGLLALAVFTTLILLAAYMGFTDSVPDVSARAAMSLTAGVICFAIGYPNVVSATTYHCGECGHCLGGSMPETCSRCGEILSKS